MRTESLTRRHDTQEWRRTAAATRRSRSRARILEAARDLFAAQGFEQVTVADVATRAGIGSVTVYNCFGSKDALAAAVLGCHVEELVRQAEEDGAQLPTAEALTRHLRRVVDLFAAHPELGQPFLAVVMRRQRPVESASDPRALAPIPQPLAVLLRAGQRRGDVRADLDATDTAAMITNVLLLRIVARREPPELAVAAVASLILRGVLES